MKYRERLLRTFAAVGAVMTLAVLPAAVWTSATAVEHPLKLQQGATPDGKARVLVAPPGVTGPTTVSEVRYGDGSWMPATRFDAIRERAGLSRDTHISYRVETG